MKAIRMRGRLTGKRISGFIWAGEGNSWQQKANYFQLEHAKRVSAAFSTEAGQFWVRCYGSTCSVTLKDAEGHILGTNVIALPRGRRGKRLVKQEHP